MNDATHSEERQAANDLVSRVRNGDLAAEAEIIERYSRGLRFLLRRKTRDPHLAEDFLVVSHHLWNTKAFRQFPGTVGVFIH